MDIGTVSLDVGGHRLFSARCNMLFNILDAQQIIYRKEERDASTR